MPLCALSALLHSDQVREGSAVLVLAPVAAVNPGRAGWESNDIPGPGVGPDISAAVAAEEKNEVTAVFFADSTATMGGAHAILFNSAGDAAVSLARNLASQALATGDFFCSQQGSDNPLKRTCESLSPEGSALVLSPTKAAAALAPGLLAVPPVPYHLSRFNMRLAWPAAIATAIKAAYTSATLAVAVLAHDGPAGKDRRPSS